MSDHDVANHDPLLNCSHCGLQAVEVVESPTIGDYDTECENCGWPGTLHEDDAEGHSWESSDDPGAICTNPDCIPCYVRATDKVPRLGSLGPGAPSTVVRPPHPTVEALSVPAPAPQPKKLPVVGYDPRAHGALCDECPCNGQIVVPPTIPSSPVDAIIVGRDPGAEEERQGRPMIGPTGKRLDRILKKFDLERDRMHITNAALCWARMDEDRPKAHKCCKPRLENEINQYPKNVPVVPMGNEATWSTLNTKARITMARGFVWKRDDREYFPTLHPAFVLRDQIQSPLLNRDMRRVALRIKQGFLTLDEPKDVQVPKSLAALKKLLARFKKTVALDVETTEESATTCSLLCIGLSDGDLTIVIPWNPVYAPILNKWVKTKIIVCHNGPAFDQIVCGRHGIHIKEWNDTLIAHHCFASHFPQRLDHVISMYCDAIPWKIIFGKRAGDEKGQAKVLTDDELYHYNSYDSYLTILAWNRMQEDLEKHSALYIDTDKHVADMCNEMQRNGIYVDQTRRAQLSTEIQIKEARLYKEMAEMAGFEFVPTKPADIRKILFETLKAPILYRTEKTNQPSTGKQALWELSLAKDRPYVPFCQKLTEWRRCIKIRKTHIDNIPIEPDGRVHPSWRSFGTPTSRLAVRKPNVQNIKNPEDLFKNEPEQKAREIYCAPPGKILVAFDMEQAEPRISAYLSDDPNFIASVESGDIHSASANIIFNNPPELVDPKERKHGKGKDLRQVAKICGLAISYGAGAHKVFDTIRTKGFAHRCNFTMIVAALQRLQKAYRVYYKFVESNIDHARHFGFIKVGFLSGRIRWVGHAPDPSVVSNSPIQASAGDVMNERLVRIFRRVKRERPRVLLTAQVHDSGVFECFPDDVEPVKTIIREEWTPPVTFPSGREVVFPIEMKQGLNWSEI